MVGIVNTLKDLELTLKFFLCVFLLVIIFSCKKHLFPINDVTNFIKPGSRIDESFLNEVEQIIRYKEGFFALRNISNDCDYSEYYVFYFNKNDIFESAFYSSYLGIKSIENDTIYMYESPVYQKRLPYRVNDIPTGFKLFTIKTSGGMKANRNKLVKNISAVDTNIYIKKTVKFVYQKGFKDNYIDAEDLLHSDELTVDSIELHLNEIHFAKEYVFLIHINDGKSMIKDIFLFDEEKEYYMFKSKAFSSF